MRRYAAKVLGPERWRRRILGSIGVRSCSTARPRALLARRAPDVARERSRRRCTATTARTSTASCSRAAWVPARRRRASKRARATSCTSRAAQWHTFWNAGDEPARILEIISPAGFEQFFAELVPLGGVAQADPSDAGSAGVSDSPWIWTRTASPASSSGSASGSPESRSSPRSARAAGPSGPRAAWRTRRRRRSRAARTRSYPPAAVDAVPLSADTPMRVPVFARQRPRGGGAASCGAQRAPFARRGQRGAEGRALRAAGHRGEQADELARRDAVGAREARSRRPSAPGPRARRGSAWADVMPARGRAAGAGPGAEQLEQRLGVEVVRRMVGDRDQLGDRRRRRWTGERRASRSSRRRHG